MSVRVMTWVWEHSRSRSTDRLVLLAIADCASDDGSNAYPSMAALRKKTGLSERAVQTSLGRLVALGELFVGYQTGPGRCNRYRIVMATPADIPPQEMRGAADAPPQDMHPARNAPPAPAAPSTPQDLHPNPAGSAPGTVNEPSIEPSVEPSSSELALRPDVEQICAHLAHKIEGNGSLRPNVTKGWRTAARLLLDKDGRTVDQVLKAIDWCQGDEFWRSKIMSMPKLREKYDQLRLEAQRRPGRPKQAPAERPNWAAMRAQALEEES